MVSPEHNCTSTVLPAEGDRTSYVWVCVHYFYFLFLSPLNMLYVCQPAPVGLLRCESEPPIEIPWNDLSYGGPKLQNIRIGSSLEVILTLRDANTTLTAGSKNLLSLFCLFFYVCYVVIHPFRASFSLIDSSDLHFWRCLFSIAFQDAAWKRKGNLLSIQYHLTNR